MQISKYIGTTALLAVLASPAFAQTVIVQDTPSILQNSQSSSIISSPGVVVTSILGQESTNVANGVGTTGAFGVGSPYSVSQTAGTPSTSALFGPPILGQAAINVNSATSTAPALSNVTVGGNQLASNAVNLANIAPVAASTGVVGQIVSNADLFASNSMSATVTNGNASIIGANGSGGAGFQNASGSLNTGSAVVTTSTDLKLNQTLGDANTVTAVNSAIANSTASGSTLLDPAVQSLNQSSRVGVNQMGFASANGAATVGLSGGQNGTTPQDGVIPDRLQVTIGNTAVAYTGAPAFDYNIGSNAPGNGIATITGVTQNASFGLNNVSGGAGVSINVSAGAAPVVDPGAPAYGFAFGPADGFTQSVDGTYLGNSPFNGPGQPVYTASSNVLDGVVNGMAARTNTGSSSITGVQGTLTQGYNAQINSLTTGGTLAGTATQAATNIQQTNTVYSQAPISVVGYANAAVADTVAGPATITNVSQRMDQTINLAASSGTGAGGLALTQTGGNIQLGTNNVQVAQGSSSASIAGAQQLANSALNVAALGGGSGTISQGTTGPVNLAAVNQLGSLSSYNASVSGFQSSSTGVNVIK